MTERWDRTKGDKTSNAWDVDSFLAEINEVCRKYNMCIGHEDTHGAFIVFRGYDQDVADWLSDAMIGVESDKP